jgi:hypothetical protein
MLDYFYEEDEGCLIVDIPPTRDKGPGVHSKRKRSSSTSAQACLLPNGNRHMYEADLDLTYSATLTVVCDAHGLAPAAVLSDRFKTTSIILPVLHIVDHVNLIMTTN